MPSKSEAQRSWAFGAKGEKWAREHHMDNKGKLPPRVKGKKHAGKGKAKKMGDKKGKGKC